MHLHIAVVISCGKLSLPCDTMRGCAKIIIDKNSISVPLLWKSWHFKLDLWSVLLARFRVRDINYLSVGFISRIFEAILMFFLWLVKNRADFGSAQNTHFLQGFFARKNFLALAGADSLVPVFPKRDGGNIRSFLFCIFGWVSKIWCLRTTKPLRKTLLLLHVHECVESPRSYLTESAFFIHFIVVETWLPAKNNMPTDFYSIDSHKVRLSSY